MNRLHVFCMLTGLLVASSWAQQNPQGMAEKAPTGKGQAGQQPNWNKYPTEQAPFPIRVIESPSDASDRKASAASSAEHEAKDLEAQVRSANAAEEQVLLGNTTAVLSFLGLCALIWTLYETRRSASAAARAANAAESAVSNAKESAEKQLRAYVWRDTGDEIFERDHALLLYTVQSHIRNSGQTPASDVLVWAKLDALPRELPIDFVFDSAPEKISGGTGFVVNPGSFHTLSVHFASSAKTDLELSQGVLALYQWGEIRYYDVFGQPRRTRFRLRLLLWDKPRSETFGIWSYCDEGNDAT